MAVTAQLGAYIDVPAGSKLLSDSRTRSVPAVHLLHVIQTQPSAVSKQVRKDKRLVPCPQSNKVSS